MTAPIKQQPSRRNGRRTQFCQEYCAKMTDDLISTIDNVIQLLKECGETDRAKWFVERQAVVTAMPTASAEFQAAIHQVQDILVGMGSFSDLALTPRKHSTLTREMAREQQWDLTERLGTLIRSMRTTQS